MAAHVTGDRVVLFLRRVPGEGDAPWYTPAKERTWQLIAGCGEHAAAELRARLAEEQAYFERWAPSPPESWWSETYFQRDANQEHRLRYLMLVAVVRSLGSIHAPHAVPALERLRDLARAHQRLDGVRNGELANACELAIAAIGSR